MSEPVDLTQALGDLLDIHLSQSIKRWKSEPEMRGMSRLAQATRTVLQSMDDEAGQVADELIAAQAESKVVIEGFRGVVSDIKANNQEVRDILAQLTNSPPLSASGNSNG